MLDVPQGFHEIVWDLAFGFGKHLNCRSRNSELAVMHGSILTVLVVQVQLEVEDDLLQISEVFARLCRTGWHIGCCLKNVVDLIILVKLLHIDHRGSLVRQRVDQEDFC